MTCFGPLCCPRWRSDNRTSEWVATYRLILTFTLLHDFTHRFRCLHWLNRGSWRSFDHWSSRPRRHHPHWWWLSWLGSWQLLRCHYLHGLVFKIFLGFGVQRLLLLIYRFSWSSFLANLSFGLLLLFLNCFKGWRCHLWYVDTFLMRVIFGSCL